MSAGEDHRDRGRGVGNRPEQADLKIRSPRRCLDHLRQKEADPVQRDWNGEVYGGDRPHPAAPHRGRDRAVFHPGAADVFLKAPRERGALALPEPPGILRAFEQRAQHDQAKHDARHAFDEEQPLPAGETAARQRQQCPGDR